MLAREKKTGSSCIEPMLKRRLEHGVSFGIRETAFPRAKKAEFNFQRQVISEERIRKFNKPV
jgi:hypothetical protein